MRGRYQGSWRKCCYSKVHVHPTKFQQKKVGTLPKDVAAGPFAEEWKKAYGDISKDVEEFDISTTLSVAAFAVKDENELVIIPLPMCKVQA